MSNIYNTSVFTLLCQQRTELVISCAVLQQISSIREKKSIQVDRIFLEMCRNFQNNLIRNADQFNH